MDFLQVKAPGIYRFVRKCVPRNFKQVILRALTTKDPFLMYALQKEKEKNKAKQRVEKGNYKISFIIIREENETINLFKELKILLFSFLKHKEFIIVTKTKPQVRYRLLYKPKIVQGLSAAIAAATGEYLCFLDHKEGFISNSAGYLYELIKDTRADIYIGNYVSKGDLVRILPSGTKYNYTKAVLPAGFALGLKVISREIAVRLRLPRGDISRYILQGTDLTDRVVFCEKPLVMNNLNDAESGSVYKDAYNEQKKMLEQRVIYGRDLPKVTGVDKVLFVVPYLVIGGAEKVLLDLVTVLINKGIAVHIFCTHKSGEWQTRFKKTGASIFVSGKTGTQDKLQEIHHLCLKNDYDVVHMSNTEYGHYYAPMSKELDRKPVIIDTVHSQNNPLLKFTLENQASIDKIITVNQLINKVISPQVMQSNKVRTVLNGVRVDAVPTEASVRFKKKEIIFLGRISEEKNPMQFVNLAKQALEKHSDWNFKVIGDGPMLKQMKDKARALGIESKIVFLGAKDNGAAELASASCFVITSYTEGLPVTLLEAMTLGLPVVSSNVGGISEVLKNGESGYLVDQPDDTVKYVEALEKIFALPEAYKEISAKAKRISAYFTAENMASKVLEIYKEAIDEQPSRLNKITNIAMLSFNRKDELKRTLETIYDNTNVPFELTILDNNSEEDTKKFLTDFKNTHNNIRVFFEKTNLGCPGGRRKMLEKIKADYIVTIDNDMEVPRHWLRDLIIRLEEDKKIMGVCVKDVFPWGKVEFTGGKILRDENGFSLFNSTYYRKDYNDLTTLEEFDCDWIPGGATLWRGNIKQVAEHAKEYVNAFEDFDYSLQIIRNGYRIVNCPNVMFIHNHASGYDKKKQKTEAKYLRDRNDQRGFLRSIAVFYKRTGLVIKNDKLFNDFGFNSSTNLGDIVKLFEKEAPDVEPIK